MKNTILVSLLIVLAFSGCKSTQTTGAANQIKSTSPNIAMQETYWKLTELMGKPVKQSEGMKKEIHIILKTQDNRLQGFGGCNTLMGKYELKEGNRIAFSGVASTMMACPDLAIETEFNKMLGAVDNYSINGNTMSLNKARMAPMARFEAVFLK